MVVRRSGTRVSGALVSGRSGRSGCPGNASRKSQLERGVLKRPSGYLVQVHRGTEPKLARQRETEASATKWLKALPLVPPFTQAWMSFVPQGSSSFFFFSFFCIFCAPGGARARAQNPLTPPGENDLRCGLRLQRGEAQM